MLNLSGKTVNRRRVVITGVGVISPIGNSAPTAWQNALDGKSGVRLIDSFDTAAFSTKFAGLVNQFDISAYMAEKEAKKCDLFIQYGIAAGVQAIKDAAIDSNQNLNRVGVIVGSGIGGIGSIEANCDLLHAAGPRRISPFFIPSSIVNMIAGYLSIMFGFTGPNLALATACTTGTHAIGLAERLIRYGDADLMIAGGAEKASTPLGIGGFAAARALSVRNDAPERASRPWDVDRDGFVLGDGAGVLVLEEYEHAKARNAKIYAELTGFAMSGDAFHITRPSGQGALSAMELALQDAGVAPSDVDYINAHATSTKAGDTEESKAILKLVGIDHAKKLLVSSTKSMTGHLLGAAGAVEAIFTILALHNQIVPPTINLDNIDPEVNFLDYVPHKPREARLNVALSNSFGFGGTNGTLVFEKI